MDDLKLTLKDTAEKTDILNDPENFNLKRPVIVQ